ncbi:Unknown protein sequence [Pseudomonas savastanoi pv. phaseolicola]|nr:Unknown protein sequence [Pseudomonas savastanoi pv. phaseolicola]KPB73287.1 Unknown protein sequence [Pseudomonas amygdali pv. mellea]
MPEANAITAAQTATNRGIQLLQAMTDPSLVRGSMSYQWFCKW